MKLLSVLLVSVLAASVLSGVSAQAPIPYRPDGYQIGGPVSAPIVLDAFVDLLCPDCAAAWPNFKAVIDHYKSNLSFALHTFPLPYHTLGFIAAQSAHVVVGASPTSTRAYADFMFTNQQQFWNDAIANQTVTESITQLQNIVVEAGFVTEEMFAAGMADDNINEDTRVSWKYACSRGVLGTPTCMVNGVDVSCDPSWTLAEWQTILDPLLQPQPTAKAAPKKQKKCSQRVQAVRTFHKHATSCPAGEPACQFLPGKVECCLQGEMCIPNVGCRC